MEALACLRAVQYAAELELYYFQKKGQTEGSCDFSGTATVSQTAPIASTSCVYPASPSQTVTTTTTTPTTSTTTSLVFCSGISPTGSGTTGINDSSATLPLITRGHYAVLFSGPDPLVSVAADLIILHLVQKKMCGQDVTMIEPRLVIWNLEAIPTKEFFLFSFFLLSSSYVKKKKELGCCW
ncbi:hypothetical protein RGQ29_015996 [Quercus rubra]|uniref:X8 domain-containing protein n=1 Tax=Quercus rubra TaxID=3512 RepID=A0AAN7FRG6_QUERU|nr:hypothetical protein RGQ29_015996 [Quercus rubra]